MGNFSDLPEEIVVDILYRLPAKSVGRCRCVVKPWRALLSTTQFAKTHLEKSKNNARRPQSLILHSDAPNSLTYASFSEEDYQAFDEITVTAKKVRLPRSFPAIWCAIYGSYDGLVLVADKELNQFLFNPLTREIRRIPQPPFAPNVTKNLSVYGLGHDPVTDEYKIVSVTYLYPTDQNPPSMIAGMYSLKTGSWKKLESPPHVYFVCHTTLGAIVNGCFHWLASRILDDRSVILAFDLEREKFYEVSPPRPFKTEEFLANQHAVLGGCLLVHYIKDGELWVMKEYGDEDSWTKITVSESKGYPKCFLDHEQALMLNRWGYAIYDLNKGSLMDLEIDGISNGIYCIRTFLESLISPFDGCNGTTVE